VTATGAGTDPRRPLLAGLIDHAALFPPASMSVADAVAEDRRARSSPYAWMLGRFVCPASKLAALGEEMPWNAAPRLSVVLDGGGPAAVKAAARAGAPVEAVEVPPGTAAPAELSWPAYLVLPPTRRVEEAVADAAAAGARVKLRCGGERVPSVERVALVVAACRDAGCLFKATAGLHHPIRRTGEHGFLNLLAAAAFAHARGAAVPDLERLLGEERPDAFAVGPDGLSVHGARVDAGEIAAAREKLFSGFGSCSWREPVEDLRGLGIL
jgi:hypothetical protein